MQEAYRYSCKCIYYSEMVDDVGKICFITSILFFSIYSSLNCPDLGAFSFQGPYWSELGCMDPSLATVTSMLLVMSSACLRRDYRHALSPRATSKGSYVRHICISLRYLPYSRCGPAAGF